MKSDDKKPSISTAPDLDWSQVRETVRMLNLAVAQIDKAMKWGKPGVSLVYRYDVPGTKLSLFGFALSGETGETNFMSKIDISSPKHTAFLPYEFLVMDN